MRIYKTNLIVAGILALVLLFASGVPPIHSQSTGGVNSESVYPMAGEPFSNTILSVLPDADGTTIRFAAGGDIPDGAATWLSVNQGIGPGAHRLSYAMSTGTNNQLTATAVGFAPRTDIGTTGDSTIQLTTTTTSGVQFSDELSLLRAFVEPTETRTILADDGALTLEILSSETNPTFSDETYLAILSTNAQPGPLPDGVRLVGNAYSVRPSGSILESQKLMTLNMLYNQAELGDDFPQSLAIAAWEFNGEFAGIVGGELLESQQLVTLPIERFRIYGLVATNTWRDSFSESSLPGVDSRESMLWGPDQNLVLASDALTGTALSALITLPDGKQLWNSVHYSATVPAESTIVVDLITTNGTVIASNVQDGMSLDQLSADEHPALRLRATLQRSSVDIDSPQLLGWQLQWQLQKLDLYVPLVAY